MRPTRPERPLLLLGLLLLAGCGPPPSVDGGDARPPAPRPSASTGAELLHLEGSARGPLPGLGPSLDFRLWLREDHALRAELRTEGEGGRPVHEVLVWTPEVALLMDRRSGRFTELGEIPGRLELAGASLRPAHLIWLALGWGVGEAAAAPWQWTGREWRAEVEGLGLRGGARSAGGRLEWTELVWKTPAGEIQRLRCEHEGRIPTGWGELPAGLSLEGSVLEGRATLQWRAALEPDPGLDLLDPLWEPTPPEGVQTRETTWNG